MERDKMKIIEFGRDGGDPSRPAPAGEAPGGVLDRDPAGTRPHRADAGPDAPARMKIIEFDGGEPEGGRRPATAARRPPAGEIAHIRIVEFEGGEPRTERVSRPAPARAHSGAPVRVAPIKIREFGEEHDARSRGAGGKGPKIKILEFD